MSYIIPKGVFFRYYGLSSNESATVVYNTISQSVVLLEGDSAEVGKRVLESGGKTDSALDYILKNGTFENDPQEESRSILSEFLKSLAEADFLADSESSEVKARTSVHRADNIREVVEPSENPALQIGQFMADHHIFYDLTFETTYRCNEHCVHCYLPSVKSPQELSIPEIEKLLTEFYSLGGFSILLTGGELLIRKDILDIFKIVKSLGLMPSMISNLNLLDEDKLQAIIELSPRSVGCSIYSARAELHDAITTVKGSFEKSVHSIRQLRSAGVPVIIKTPLMRSTAPYWKEIGKLAEDLDCEYQMDLGITAKNDGGLSPLAQRVEDEELLKEIYSSRFYNLFLNNEALADNVHVSPEAGLCGAGASGLCIEPNGMIRPCIGLNIPLGKYPEKSLSDIWYHSPFFKDFGSIKLKDIPECEMCSNFIYCVRCPGAWLAEHGNFRKPAPYTCKLARIWANVQNSMKKGGEKNEVKSE